MQSLLQQHRLLPHEGPLDQAAAARRTELIGTIVGPSSCSGPVFPGTTPMIIVTIIIDAVAHHFPFEGPSFFL